MYRKKQVLSLKHEKNYPSISVLIVAGGGRVEAIKRCISSVLRAFNKSIPIIVVDNSSDPSLERDIKTRFPSIIFYRMPRNTGLLAFNFGLANSETKYVLVLDDDCEIPKKEGKKIHEFIKHLSAGVAVVSLNVYNPLIKRFTYERFIRNRVKDIITFAGGAVIINRIHAQRFGWFDDSFFLWMHEDDLALQMINAGYRVLFESGIVINHYEKEEYALRKNKLFLVFRNKAWVNLKYLSWIFFPLFIMKDFWWMGKNQVEAAQYILKKSKFSDLSALAYPWVGYVWGYFTFFRVIKKRKTLNFQLQKRYMFYYVLNRFI